MKKKPEKKKDMEALQAEFAKARNVFLTSYEKLTVGQDFELRKTVRGAGGTYKVIKNTIAEKAAEGTPAENLLKELKAVLCDVNRERAAPVAEKYGIPEVAGSFDEVCRRSDIDVIDICTPPVSI